MSGFDDLVNQGKALYEQNKDKIDDFLQSEQAEDLSDKALDGASGLAKKFLPDEHDTTIDGVRDKLDGAIGDK